MFGIIVSGRLVDINFQQIAESKFATTIQDADNINHIVVFLTGTQPFPIGTAGSVYFSWPDADAPPTWQLLGHISNDKPSAIFKIHNLKKTNEISDLKKLENARDFCFGDPIISHNAQIGISIEPILTVQAQANTVAMEKSASFSMFSRKMLENFMNYASSFGVSQAQMTPNPSETYFPMSTLQSWHTYFERRIQLDPYFWRN